ncbi:hypothetical protein DY245_22620 [Streptomyces inhibens]|uniref:Uncharacterized protein n=2 Tax=Streptomyces inhibens TaxID=2293571 RepID=A0A371Q0L0_STRIH|nr:hypothetical protein DY245_22620 [Streptomyces inhibens]
MGDPATGRTGGVEGAGRAWAELLRISALFSVPGDLLAGATAGTTAASLLGAQTVTAATPTAAPAAHGRRRVLPPGRLGIQLYTLRDQTGLPRLRPGLRGTRYHMADVGDGDIDYRRFLATVNRRKGHVHPDHHWIVERDNAVDPAANPAGSPSTAARSARYLRQLRGQRFPGAGPADPVWSSGSV